MRYGLQRGKHDRLGQVASLPTCAGVLGARRDGCMSAADGPTVAWRKSSACLPSDCVEVASVDGHVLIRDSADVAGGYVLTFSHDQWFAFTRHLMRKRTQQRKCELPLKLVALCAGQTSGYMAHAGSIPVSSIEAVTAWRPGPCRRTASSCL
jgi:hypothetical protein